MYHRHRTRIDWLHVQVHCKYTSRYGIYSLSEAFISYFSYTNLLNQSNKMPDQDQAVENAKKTTISYAQDWGRESHSPQLTPPQI